MAVLACVWLVLGAGPVHAETAYTVTGADYDPDGVWFAHLSSYSKAGDVQKYVLEVEKKYPTLVGLVSVWEVNTSEKTIYRLGMRLGVFLKADRFCIAVRANGDYCTVLRHPE